MVSAAEVPLPRAHLEVAPRRRGRWPGVPSRRVWQQLAVSRCSAVAVRAAVTYPLPAASTSCQQSQRLPLQQ